MPENQPIFVILWDIKTRRCCECTNEFYKIPFKVYNCGLNYISILFQNCKTQYIRYIPSIISCAVDVALPSKFVAMHLTLPESLSLAPGSNFDNILSKLDFNRR